MLTLFPTFLPLLPFQDEVVDCFYVDGLKGVEELTAQEVSTLSGGVFPWIGPAALEAYQIWSLMQLSDPVAAVSCEAFKVGRFA